MSYVFVKRAEPTPVFTALEKPGYFDALQEADRGTLRTFVQMLETKRSKDSGTRREASRTCWKAGTGTFA